MHAMSRLPHLTGILLLLAAPWAGAESPMPDPIAPAVVGRPLDRIRPARPLPHRTDAAQAARRKQVAATHKAVRAAPPPRVALAPSAAAQRVPTQTFDRRVVPSTQVAGNVGAAPRFAGPPMAPGGYFSSRDLALVRGYYQAHPVSGQAATWKAGEPIPQRAALTGVPDDLRAALTALPPGHQYVQVDGEVVLVAVPSRVVVAGISRGIR